MKALTLHQPWATLIAEGRKLIETRPWSTEHRGRLAIHAGLTIDREACRRFHVDPDALPTGMIIATAELCDVTRIRDAAWRQRIDVPYVTADGRLLVAYRQWYYEPHGDDHRVSIARSQKPYGNFHPNRFAWLLDDVRRVQPGVRARGKQHLWDAVDEIVVAREGTTS